MSETCLPSRCCGRQFVFEPSTPGMGLGVIGLLLVASWLAPLSGCAVNDHKVDMKMGTGSRKPATPIPRVVPTTPVLPKGSGRRHVILVIGDGMQLAHEIAGSRYLYGVDRSLAFHDFPEQTYKTTWDANVYAARATELKDLPPYSPESFDPKVGYDPAIGGAAPYPALEDNELRRAYFWAGSTPTALRRALL